MASRRVLGIVAAVTLLSLVPGAVWAQGKTTGRLSGKVTAADGSAVVGATVTVVSQSTGLERSATTSAAGDYLLDLLPTGSYVVTIESTGMQPEAYTVDLGVGQILPLNVTLQPGGEVAETITVTGEASALETTTTGASFDSEKINDLPVFNRQLESIASLSPNISFGPTGGTISISGAPSFDTTVLLDGAEISDPYFGSAPVVYLEDAIEEVQVLTSGVSARFGRFQGGVINAITKSGGNEFEGSIRGDFDKQSWNEKSPFGEDQSTDLNKVYQATLGGYILKDRLWFFVGGRTIPTSSTSATASFTGEDFSTSRSEDRYQGKLRGAFSSNHLVDLSYLNYESTISNYNGLAAGDDLALGKRLDPREIWTLGYQGVLSANSYLELQATQKDVSIQAGGDPSKGDPFLDLVLFATFHNHWWDFNDADLRNNQTASGSFTHTRDLGRAGTHVFEGGIQWVQSETGGSNAQSSTGYNLLTFNEDFAAGDVNGDPRFNLREFSAFRWVALDQGGKQTIDNQAIYVQDGWTLGKLRFDLGLRYEKYDGEGPVTSLALDYDALAPRLGVTYSLNDSWQLQATYGQYVSRFNDNVAGSSSGVGGAPRIETFYTGPDVLNATGAQIQAALRNDAYWQFVTDYVSIDQPTTFLASGLEAPHADDLTLSVRTALPGNSGSVVLSYIDRDYKKLIDDFVGGVCDYGIDFGRACPAADTTVIVVDGEPFAEVDTTIWANNPRARRDYKAITVVGDYRPSSSWSIGGNYTYAKTRANYEGEGTNTPSSGSPWGDYEKSVNLAAATPYGYADDDIRNRGLVYSQYRWNFGGAGALTLGGLLRYQSGLPYSLVANVALRDVPEYLGDSGTYTHYFSGRGARRFNDWWRADLSAVYDFKFFRDLGAYIKVGVQNVTNNDEVVSFQTTGRAVRDASGNLSWTPVGNCGLNSEPSKTCTSFGKIRGPNDYQTPRTYLASFALTF
jgi:hypothetical protein